MVTVRPLDLPTRSPMVMRHLETSTSKPTLSRRLARLARVSLELDWSQFSARDLLLHRNGEGIVFVTGLKANMIRTFNVLDNDTVNVVWTTWVFRHAVTVGDDRAVSLRLCRS